MRRTSTLAVSIFFFLGSSVSAQVPDGWYALSAFKAPACTGLGGLFLAHPRTPGAMIPVTGLVDDLTGMGTAGIYQGAGSVLFRPDGTLIVGEHAPAGTLDLHVITLNGFAVATDQTIPLGTVAPSSVASTDQMAFLPSGEILVSNRPNALTSGSPLFGARLGVVDLSMPTPTVTPVPVSGVFGTTNALAVDATGTTAYLGTFVFNNPNYTTYFWSVPLATGAPSLCTTFPGAVLNLAVEASGMVLAGVGFVPPSDCLLRIDPANCAAAPIPVPAGLSVINAAAVERVTGNYALYDDTLVGDLYWSTPAGVATLLANIPPGGCVASGIAVNPNPEAYGPATPGTNSYTWDLDPNPGGLPEAGNIAFSLTISGSPASLPGFWIASLGKLDPPVPILGVQANVDLTQIVLVGGLSGANPETIRLPIPPVPSLVGGKVFFQTAHVDPSGLAGLASSSGVEVTVL